MAARFFDTPLAGQGARQDARACARCDCL